MFNLRLIEWWEDAKLIKMTQQCRSNSQDRSSRREPTGNGFSLTALATVPVLLTLLIVACKILTSYKGSQLPHLELSGETAEPESDEIQAGLSLELERTDEKFDHFYAIIIDAGSTGTRASVFQFKHDDSKFGEFKKFIIFRDGFV